MKPKKHRKGVVISRPTTSEEPQQSYMTSNEFWAKAQQGFDEICKKHGVL
jgi:hypothetical protein